MEPVPIMGTSGSRYVKVVPITRTAKIMQLSFLSTLTTQQTIKPIIIKNYKHNSRKILKYNNVIQLQFNILEILQEISKGSVTVIVNERNNNVDNVPLSCKYRPLPGNIQIELIKKAQNNDPKAMETLQLTNSRLIFQLARKYGGQNADDYFQELFVGNPSKYSKIILSYKPEFNVKYTSYLANCVSRFFISINKTKQRNFSKSKYRNIITDRDRDNNNQDTIDNLSTGLNLEDQLIINEDYRKLNFGLSKLTNDELLVISVKSKTHHQYTKLKELVDIGYTYTQLSQYYKSAVEKLKFYLR